MAGHFTHSIVMLVLLTTYRGIVSTHSLEDMSVRVVAWLIILALMFFQSRRQATK